MAEVGDSVVTASTDGEGNLDEPGDFLWNGKNPDGIGDLSENDSFMEGRHVEMLWDIKKPDCLYALSEEEDENSNPAPLTATQTPQKSGDSFASSPQFYSPCVKGLVLPFSSCAESPIEKCLVAASTPFQGKRISSTSSASNDLQAKRGANYVGNATFTMDEKSLAGETISTNVNRGDGTFVKEDKNLTFTKDQNLTFDAKPVEKDSGSDVMDSCMKLESSSESTEDKSQRKPLKAIPQPKATNTKTNGSKKSSRLIAPRMNAAALSRMQARNTGNSPPKGSNVPEKCIQTSETVSLKSRKSLLPPRTNSRRGVCKTANVNRNHGTISEESSGALSEDTSSSPTKRKVQESPKRPSKSQNPHSGTQSALPSRKTNNPARSSSAPTSRPPQRSARSSRLQKPSGLKGPLLSRSTNNLDTEKVIGPGAMRPSARESRKTMYAPSRKGGSLVASRDLKPKKNFDEMLHLSKCATAMAILLDYVVNRLDGLAAPRLLKENERLQKLAEEKNQLNKDLSSQLSEVREKIETAKKDFELTAKRNEEVFEQQLQKERDTRLEIQEMVDKLSMELENEKEMRREETAGLEWEIGEIKEMHEAEIASIQEEHESAMQQLQNECDQKMQDDLKELIKPYLNAESEVESLTAVLDLKNVTIHKLEAKCERNLTEADEMAKLRNQLELLTQENEDLSARFHEKVNENRRLSVERDKLRQSLSEEHNRSKRDSQHIEELEYRLECVSPTKVT